MSDWYILHDDHSVTKAITEEEKNLAYACLENEKKVVAQEYIGNRWVSTVFIGLDHSYGGTNSPVIFETLVFENDRGQDTWRYSTWQEAMEGHRKVCAELQSGLTREELEAAKAIIDPLLNRREEC